MDSKRGDKTSGGGSAPKEKEGDIFDVKRIRRLVELMNEHELAEIDLRQADQRIRLRKGGEVIETTVAPRPAAATATPAAGGSAPAAPSSDEGLLIVKSPMIGTFYVSSSPDTPPFVKVGDHVGPTSTICLIEAMKVFNEIPAEVAGKVVSVLVANGEPVEFGQPLFKVDPRQ